METLNYIQALMGAYALDLSSIDTENEAEYNERAQAVRECTIPYLMLCVILPQNFCNTTLLTVCLTKRLEEPSIE